MGLLVFLGKLLFSGSMSLMFSVIPKPRKSVAGEIVLITGSGGGLGRLLALHFVRLGSVLVLWDVNTEANEETRRMAQETGTTRVHAYTCDCSRKEEVYRVAEQVNLGNSSYFMGSKAFCKYLGIYHISFIVHLHFLKPPCLSLMFL